MAGPSAFEIQNQLGHSPSPAKAATIDHGSVEGGASLNGGNTVTPSHGKAFSAALAGGQSQVDAILQQKISLGEGHSMDNLMHTEGAMEGGIFDVLDKGNMSPLELAHGPLIDSIQGEQPQLQDISVIKQSGANIQGATSVVSPQAEGRE